MFNPLNPKIKIWILICCPVFLSYRSSGEKLIKYQANSSCVIMSVILMTTLFYKALILPGEIWCWSLLGLKGLKMLPFHLQIAVTYFTFFLEFCTTCSLMPIKQLNCHAGVLHDISDWILQYNHTKTDVRVTCNNDSTWKISQGIQGLFTWYQNDFHFGMSSLHLHIFRCNCLADMKWLLAISELCRELGRVSNLN